MKKYLLFVALPIVLLYSIGCAAHFWEDPRYSLYKNGIKTEAVITRTDCSNHASISYQYNVDGVNFNGGGVDTASKPCREWSPGDHILITYLQSDPKINEPGEQTEEKFYHEMVGSLFITLVFSAGVFMMFKYRLKSRTTKN